MGLIRSFSDVDTKAIVLPHLDDFLLGNNRISKIIEIDKTTGDQCDVKDIISMVENWKKQNINYLEILFTEYFKVAQGYEAEMYRLIRMAEDIALYNPNRFINAIRGMILQKISHVIAADESGYNLKNYVHADRLSRFLYDWTVEQKSFLWCLRSGEKSRYIIENPPSLSYVIRDLTIITERTNLLTEEALDKFVPYSHMDNELRDVILSVNSKLVEEKEPII